MAIKDYFPENHEKKELVDKLSKATLTSKSTVYKWLKGDILPPPLKQQIIADIMQVPAKILFPNART